MIFMAKLWENPWKTHGCSWQITYRKPPFSSINREFPMETNAKKKVVSCELRSFTSSLQLLEVEAG
jgi:hypothetical protein